MNRQSNLTETIQYSGLTRRIIDVQNPKTPSKTVIALPQVHGDPESIAILAGSPREQRLFLEHHDLIREISNKVLEVVGINNFRFFAEGITTDPSARSDFETRSIQQALEFDQEIAPYLRDKTISGFKWWSRRRQRKAFFRKMQDEIEYVNIQRFIETLNFNFLALHSKKEELSGDEIAAYGIRSMNGGIRQLAILEAAGLQNIAFGAEDSEAGVRSMELRIVYKLAAALNRLHPERRIVCEDDVNDFNIRHDHLLRTIEDKTPEGGTAVVVLGKGHFHNLIQPVPADNHYFDSHVIEENQDIHFQIIEPRSTPHL